jgi:hypothetical protein
VLDTDYAQIILAPLNATGKIGSLADFASEAVANPMGFTRRDNAGGGDAAWDVGVDGVDGAYATASDGYVLEVKFPWADVPFGAQAPAAGLQFRFLAGIVDRDNPENAEVNVFVLSSGAGTNNPFENHEDLGVLTLTGEVTVEPVVFRFDCDNEGFTATHNVSLDHAIGSMVVKPTDGEGGDPYASAMVYIAGNTLNEFGAAIEVRNAPDANPIPCALLYRGDAGWKAASFNLTEGNNEVRLSLAAADGWDNSIVEIRLDLPNADVASYLTADTTFLVDILAFSTDPNYAPAAGTETLDNDCDNDGLSNDQEAIHGTDPTLADTDGDGASDGLEVANGTDPLDPEESVGVPVMNYVGLALTSLLLCAAALVLVNRRRSTTH